ncbi:MAG: glycoside hydrolase family 2 TIM barrel-domain containing protein [Casimicrobium sp.]
MKNHAVTTTGKSWEPKSYKPLVVFRRSVARASAALAMLALSACANNSMQTQMTTQTTQSPTHVTVQTINGKSQLIVNGKAFYVKGAGLEFGSPETLAANGGNAMRTWRTENGKTSGRAVLDRAWANGLYVVTGIEIARERHGFNYDNPADVRRQFEQVKSEVLALKDHPALILWSIGNELNLNSKNPKVWNAVNEISRMIHEIDPHHPTMTTLAGINKEVVDHIKARAPDLDVLGVQMYADIVNLPRYLRESGWTRPYLVTEWGATGHWEVPKTEWGAPIENDSRVKAEFYRQRFDAAIRTDTSQCLGSFVFLWEQKQERTPTWYGMFLDSGEKTATVDVMHEIWKGAPPANRSPRIVSASLNGKSAAQNVRVRPGQSASANVRATDADGDRLTYRWEVMEESRDLKEGGDVEARPRTLTGLIAQPAAAQITFTTPSARGAYRLFAYVYDNRGAAAHVNLPFFVE